MNWALDSNGTLTISGTGAMDDYPSSQEPPWYKQRYAVKRVIIRQGITYIGICAFYHCENLREVIIPMGVTRIGKQAFDNCDSLTIIILPSSMAYIGNAAFHACHHLREITIPASIKGISEQAFYGCHSLTNVTIPAGITDIDRYTFNGCTSLTRAILPDSIEYINAYAFCDCKSLKEITIPDRVTLIGKYAFYGCETLTEVIIPANVKSVGEWVFGSCENLKKIHYPAWRGFEKNLSQGNHAQLIPYSGTPPVIKPKPIFKPPTPQPIRKYTPPPAQIKPTPQPPVSKPAPQAVVESLRWKVEGKTLTVGGVSEIKSYSYEATPWRDSFRDIQRIIIEDGVKKISANAFAECTRLEQLTIPASVKTIGDGAFTFCYCGDRTINGGRNVVWSLEDGTLMIKKNPAAKNESNFSTGYETWQVVEGNIAGVKIERGIVPANSFFDWVNRMGDGVSVTF